MSTLPRARDLSVEDALGIPEVARILGVHPRTMERRRIGGTAPRPLEVQREEKLRRIWIDLTSLFTFDNALYWLKHPVPVLDNRPPVDVMTEDGGLDRVSEVVGRMSWGIPT